MEEWPAIWQHLWNFTVRSSKIAVSSTGGTIFGFILTILAAVLVFTLEVLFAIRKRYGWRFFLRPGFWWELKYELRVAMGRRWTIAGAVAIFLAGVVFFGAVCVTVYQDHQYLASANRESRRIISGQKKEIGDLTTKNEEKDAKIRVLEGRLTSKVGQPETSRAKPPGSDDFLDSRGRRDMLRALEKFPPGKIAIQYTDLPVQIRRAGDLADVFRSGGWQVILQVFGSAERGVIIRTLDAKHPSVAAVHAALKAGGIVAQLQELYLGPLRELANQGFHVIVFVGRPD